MLSGEVTFQRRPDKRESAAKGQGASQAGRELAPGQGAASEGARRDQRGRGVQHCGRGDGLGMRSDRRLGLRDRRALAKERALDFMKGMTGKT